jgi:hypothetical protein
MKKIDTLNDKLDKAEQLIMEAIDFCNKKKSDSEDLHWNIRSNIFNNVDELRNSLKSIKWQQEEAEEDLWRKRWDEEYFV